LVVGENWTDAIPGKQIIDFSKKSLFVKQPSSHYKWDPDNYPSPQNSREFVNTPPAGDWYGFTEG